jgi:hypothetical protein
MMKILSNSLNAVRPRIRAATTMVGRITGMRTCRAIWKRDAPSQEAASASSGGTPARPARNSSIMNGVHCQTSTMTTAAKLSQGGLTDCSQTGCPPPSAETATLMTPACASYMYFHM